MANDYFNWGIRAKTSSIGSHSLGANGDFTFGTGDFTIECCFNFHNTGQLGAYQVMYIGNQAGSYADGYLSYGLGFGSTVGAPANFFCTDTSLNNIRPAINTNTGDATRALNGFRFANSQTTIMHWAGTRSSITGKFFLDGVLKATATTGNVADMTFPSNKILFGDSSCKTFYYFRISNVARDATWLAAHYKDKYYTDANVVGLYNFSTEQGSGTTIYDTSGNARNGVLSATNGEWVKVSNVYEGSIGPS